jgi:hypothetical protein
LLAWYAMMEYSIQIVHTIARVFVILILDELFFTESEFLGTHYKSERVYEKWNPLTFVTNMRTPELMYTCINAF